MVLPHIDMNPPWVYICSPSWTPLSPPSPSLPSGSSQCTSPEHPSHALNLDWRSISYTITCMFQCHSPKSSHPCPLPQSPSLCIEISLLKYKLRLFLVFVESEYKIHSFYSYTLFKLFVHLLHAVCRVQWWIYLEITPFPQSHSPPFCYPCGPHTGHVSWGKFLCSLFKGKVPPLKLIFYFLLLENGKYATVCFLFWLKCQKTWSQILVTTLSWELGSIFLSLSASFSWFLFCFYS